MSRSNIILFILSILLSFQLYSQEKKTFTKQDTLRGSITPERIWWDLTYYHLDIKVNPEEKSLENHQSAANTANTQTAESSINFNKEFLRATGKTPSEYKSSLK